MRLPKVCFIGLKCLDLLAGIEPPRYLGGIEKQLVFLASGLARRGWRICMVSYDQGQGDAVECGDVRVYRAYNREKGLYGLQFFHPRWSGVWGAMDRANADIYYQMGAGCGTGQAAASAPAHSRRIRSSMTDASSRYFCRIRSTMAVSIHYTSSKSQKRLQQFAHVIAARSLTLQRHLGSSDQAT